MKKLICLVHGASRNKLTVSKFWETCALDKSKRASRRATPAKNTEVARPLERVFSDVVGSLLHDLIER